MDGPDRVIVPVPSNEPDELDIRMAREKPNQLATDVPRRSDDPDPEPTRPAVPLGATV